MLETEMSLYAVAETHLLGLEEPPVHPNWQWAGSNREPGSRKGGGIGVLWRNGINSNWKKLAASCKEHMWMTGAILGMPVLVAVLYFSVDPGQNAENRCIAQCIAEDIQRWGSNREVLIMGDFNGHVQSIDGFQDHNGALMLQLAETFSLEVANLRPDCIGETTWSARNSRSCIDYILASPNLASHLTRVHVDESGRYSLGSDHNRIALTFSTSVHRNRRTQCRKPARRYLPATSFERVAEDFEESDIHAHQTTYEEFVGELLRTMCRYEKRVQSRGGARPKAWWDQQVKTALEARRKANRAHRYAVKRLSTEECQQAWQEFLRTKRDMQQMVQKKIAESNQKQLRAITEAGNNGPRKFWTYISSLNREAPIPTLRDATGHDVADLEEHLTIHMQRMYDNPSPEQQGVPYQPREEGCEMDNDTTAECEWKVSRVAIDRAMSNIRAHSAKGLDEIPPGLVKRLGQNARETLASIFTGIIHGDPIPEDWRRGKVCLVPKRGGNSDQLHDYRPLTVTSVLYRLFTQVIKRWMSGWAETQGPLTELQNGFRRNRRGEDNLFVLIQSIEIARRESRGLIACFLDVAKAYDSVPHGHLLSRMEDLNMPPVWIELLRRLYTGNTVETTFGGTRTRPVTVQRGLKQGCPLSPLLYMLYTAGLEHALLDSGVGFKLNWSDDGTPTTWTLPGLVFADDLVLLAENKAQLQHLVETSANHLDTLGLAFNPKKSAVLRFSGDCGEAALVLPNGEELPRLEEYRYLGVILSTSDKLIAGHENHLRQVAQRANRILRRQCLWGCSRYHMVRDLWKAVHVPALTYANSAICLSAPTRDWLERGQREVGRIALGCHGRVAVEAIQGDVGWSSFEAREASSKISFECRLRTMNDNRWARRLFRYIYIKGIRTQWRSRVMFLRRKYGLLDYVETGPERETAKGIRDRVREAEGEMWRSAMLPKTTLNLYRESKEDIATEPALYDNSCGGALLFEARAGALRTLDYRSRFDCAPETRAAVCRSCGGERETIEHLLLRCSKLTPPTAEGTTLPQALGFLDAEGNRCGKSVRTTKARLEVWWRDTRRTLPADTHGAGSV